MARRERQRMDRTPEQETPPTAAATLDPAGAFSYAAGLEQLRAEDRSRGAQQIDTSTASAGHALAGVRIYPESRSAQALGARAYTQGSDIFFGPGRYAPGTPAGRSLLAHELTHVRQQREGRATAAPHSAEQEARGAGGDHAGASGLRSGVPAGVQLAPQSREELYMQKVRISEKLKDPNLPEDERKKLTTELAGIEKALTGAEHDPNEYQGAAFIMTQAAIMVSVDNMNGKWQPWSLPPVPAAYGYMLFDFYKARSGISYADGKRTELTGKQRREHLEAGRRTAQPLIQKIEAAGEPARAWLKDIFWKHYRYVEEETYYDEANELVKGSLAAGNQPGAPSVPTISGDVEQLRGAAITGRETLSRLVTIVTRFQSGALEEELSKVMASLDKGKDLPAALQSAKSMKFAQAAFYLRGILNTIDAVLVISDLNDREKLAKRHPNLFATGTDLMWQSTRLLEGAIVLTSGLAATAAKIAGMADDAVLALQIGSRSLRVIGTIGAAFQALYGLSVLLDPDSTAEQRRGAVFNIGLGVAGIGSLPTLWGGARLWASGPWTIAVIWGGLVYQYQRVLVAGMKQGWLTYAMRWSFESLQIRAERISESAKPLAMALFHMKYLQPGPADNPAASLHGGMESVLRVEADKVRGSVEWLVDLTTKRSDWFLEREPGDFKAFRERFLPIKAALEQAKTPEETLALALSALEITRTAFQDADKIFVKELTDSLSR